MEQFLVCSLPSIARRSKDVITLCSALERHVETRAQHWRDTFLVLGFPWNKSSMDITLQQRAMRDIKRLEHLRCKERLIELRQFSLEKESTGGIISI